MKLRKFIASQERKLGRPLTAIEKAAVKNAHFGPDVGKHETLKAMRVALRAAQIHQQDRHGSG
jgi:hypothetical protein